MNLEIQARHIELDPRWRDFIVRSAARLSRHFPDVPELHVTLAHGTRGRRAAETATLIASVEGATLRSVKERETVRDALRAAFIALAVELERDHEHRKRVAKGLARPSLHRIMDHKRLRMPPTFNRGMPGPVGNGAS